jgi:UDP-hydrolysing UDP-N-acetyl-D-glucosamine 2-epimerase
MSRRVAIVTGTRAEYGLLRGVIQQAFKDTRVDPKLIVTGMHLSPEYGLTYRDIERDGFPIHDKVETLLSSDTAVGVAKAVGLGTIAFADCFARDRPDILVLLGDRFEILAAATAAMLAGIPIAHLHGGETTEGAFDEAIRHSITKMSHLHFVAAAPYRDRVLQMGEHPDRVFLVGGLGIDAISQLKLLEREALEGSLDFKLGKRNLLITFHPSTLDHHPVADQLSALLDALDGLAPDTHLIFTMPNADTGGRQLTEMLRAYVETRAHARLYPSLGQLRYISLMALVDGVVGNSSSGLAEAPTLRTGTVNIGRRQAGRLRASSIIDCEPEKESILAALHRLFSEEFRRGLNSTVNPYGLSGASSAIIETIATHDLHGITQKAFYDVPIGQAHGIAEGRDGPNG